MMPIDSRTLRERIFDAFPLNRPAFGRLLALLEIEATDAVPTAAVTLGTRSRLLVNPAFVAAKCPTDRDLVMLVLHELQHVALGHTRLFPRITPAQNWAFDCVINAQLCRMYPDASSTALFRRCYSAAAFPEALLRPPEGWHTGQERWLPGRAGEVHRALYSDLSVTYAELYALLPRVLGKGAAMPAERLLGDHSTGEPEALDPEQARALRDIIAEWPLVERRAGRDQGCDVSQSHVAAARKHQAAVTVIRRALLSVADLGCGGHGVVAQDTAPTASVLPYTLRPLRGDFVRQALGVPMLLHPGWLEARTAVRRDRVHVYLDVSGSMDAALPGLYSALVPLAGLLHPEVHLFSTVVRDVDLAQLRGRLRVTSGGTDIAPVTRHAVRAGVRRALILTDGHVGDVPAEHARTFSRRGARFGVVLTAGGDAGLARELAARTWRLPANEVKHDD